MHGRYRYLSSMLLAVAFLASALTTGCATRSYRVYDPYHNEYHRWDDSERIYYHQWVVENHYDGRDYRRLDRGQQRAYWEWRNNHHDKHDHDHDHDRDHDRH
ncbi:MAG: hypothetical protein WA637_04605 [Terriglobales bacterium]